MTASRRVLKKIGTIQGKTYVLEFPFFSFSLTYNKKETLAEVFSCKFFKIFDKSFFKEQFWATVSMTSEFISTDKNIFQSW